MNTATASTLSERTRIIEYSAVLVALVLYSPMLSAQALVGWDTITLIVTSSPNPVALLMQGADFPAGFWRPLISFHFWAMGQLYGLDPAPYYAVNIGLHAVVAWLVARLGARLIGRWEGALAGCLFALHPLALDNVPVPSRGQDIFMTAFVLLAIHAALDKRFWWSVGAFALALASKETALIAAPVLVWLLRHSPWQVMALSFTSGFYVSLRFALVGGIGGYANPAVLLITPLIYLQNVILPALPLHPLTGLAAGLMFAPRPWPRFSQSLGLSLWLMLAPLPLYLLGQGLNHWYFYLPAVGASLLTMELCLRQDWRGWLMAGAILLGTALGGVGDWLDVASYNKALLGELARHTQNGQALILHNAPGIMPRHSPPRGVASVQSHTLEAYFAWHGLDVAVRIDSHQPADFSRPPQLTFKRAKNTLHVYFEEDK